MRSPRLFVEDLREGAATVRLGPREAHHLGTVLRLGPGARVRVFGSAAGEFEAEIRALDRRGVELALLGRIRPPQPARGPDLWFAPIRRQRLEWLIEKATELGVRRLVPVVTRHTVVEPRRPERLRLIAVEAAEQCGRLDVPDLAEPRPLFEALAQRPAERPLLFADERGDASPLLAALGRLGTEAVDLLVGPEGGFSEEERARLREMPEVVPVSLGPTILRAETAALFALSVVRAFAETRP
ncbi:Ribosomal RNA small subunit methyltransferase E [bacterium HR39]|nr:Ribosomal RNA small subunit methyltransferase E [bacterium HR39]